MTPASPDALLAADVERVAKGLTKAQRAMVAARHTPDDNPWPFISITQRAGGAKDRTFRKMTAVGLYDGGNCLTPLGLAVRHHLTTGAAHHE